MIQFIIRRLISSIPVLLGIILLVFVLVRVIPGDPCTATYGEKATPALCAQFAVRYGLDQPIWQQFIIYVGALLQGDLGNSIRLGRPVSEILTERLPVTIELTILALLFAAIFGSSRVVSATRRNSPSDSGRWSSPTLGSRRPSSSLVCSAFIFAVLLKNTPFASPIGTALTGVSITPLAVAWGLQDCRALHGQSSTSSRTCT